MTGTYPFVEGVELFTIPMSHGPYDHLRTKPLFSHLIALKPHRGHAGPKRSIDDGY